MFVRVVSGLSYYSQFLVIMVKMEDEVVKNLKDEFEFDYKDAKSEYF